MQKLPFIALLVVFAQLVFAQSPHGEGLKINCSDCHTTNSWTFSSDSARFNHNQQTQFLLEGQHQYTDCNNCHVSLVFSDVTGSCVSCHNDMHNTTLGSDCARCHDANSWIIENITELHQNGRFPLLGAHNSADCSDCHTSVSLLEFEPLGVECIDCHRQNYLETNNPNHIQAGLSENCIECHNINAREWSSSGFNHSFFPLEKGHEIADCAQCHGNNIFDPLSNECSSCHLADYSNANNPSHQSTAFSTSCEECHTIDPDWKPAKFEVHDQFYFPIYSGKHQGEWDNCSDCHTQADNYTVFSCTDCHEHEISKMNRDHDDVGGYSSNSNACYACHPQGREDGAFNHSNTGFPLTGAHIANDCLDCHSQGYSGTSSECISCHTENYNLAAEPNHTAAGIASTCEDCHTTNAWKPSSFDHAGTGFQLDGAHTGRQCSDCHAGTTVGAGPGCYDCHQQNYTNAENHVQSAYPHDCTQCHNTTNWEDATFDHDATNFPLTGAHIATECQSCHTSGYAGTPTNCSACHTENYNLAAEPNHTAAGIASTCEDCHTTNAWKPSSFDHAGTGFQLDGAHAGRQCSDCHAGTTVGAGPGCYDCHQQNYTNTENHVQSAYPHDCTQCHNTTNWEDATFDHDATNFPLTGAHIATECQSCHTSGYAGTPTNCSACHTENYNLAAEPNHTAAGIASTCEDCHTTNAWKPSSFDHAGTGFQLDGAHAGRQCSDCHAGTTVGAGPGCYDCHQQNYTNAQNHVQSAYPHDCTQCHNTTNWEDATFDHDATNFPLTGAHIATECQSCHTSGYAGTPTNCSACHTENYNLAAEPNHTAAGIASTCEDCHTTNAWKPSSFDHAGTGFQLDGAHAGRQCSDCHAGTTVGAGPDCYDCHQQNYTNAQNHVQSAYPHDCTQCHNTTNWEDATFDHDATNFPLTGAHIATECQSCHTSGYAGTPTNCSACHTENYNLAAEPNHTAAGIASTCEDCHTTNAWKPSSFDHAGTGFQLDGAHAGRQCSDCHAGTTVGAGPGCYDCHQQNYTNAENHVQSAYPHDCTQCHNTTNWEDATFDHDATNFPLTGAHIATECQSCHTSGYAGTPTNCSACHTENYNLAAEPNHTAAGIASTCEDCHTTNAWKPSSFDHAGTGFQLDGAHAGRQCSDCHAGTTVGAGPDCYDCHQQNYTNAENHVQSAYPHDCTQCHNTSNWEDATFDHSATNFPLTGAHIATECQSCHTSGYAGTPTNCSACHTDNYNLAAEPNHTAAGIASTCEDCHSTNAWKPSSFDHAGTGFQLDGAHAGRQCSDCHAGTTVGAGPDCYDCHQQNYTNAENHVQSAYPHDCTQCHNTTNWEDATFDHDATNFPLTGAHIATECQSCHTSGYAGTPTNCSACHTDNYNLAAEPNHTAAGISSTCEDCHLTSAWKPSSFDHAGTGFQLDGAHAGRQCSDCHAGTTVGAGPDCYDCHQQNYTNAENHVQSAYPHDCTQCHNTSNWEDATFDHDATNFPLTGAHIATECQSCHTSGYAGTPTNCSACHTEDYNSTGNPNHANLGLSLTCDNCHTTNTGWEPAQFPDHQSYYALNGAHASIANNCFLCHEGNYTNTPTTCFACHTSDYNSANDPNHLAAQFPIDCEACHTENAWEPSTFDHDGQYFPIYSGKHRGEWNSCADCHTTASNYALFSCTDCHEHNKSEMDSEHQGVNNYVYNSINCYACHPQGSEDD